MNKIRRIIIISTSYPEIQDGREAAGSFVVDFVETLTKKIKVTVVAPGLKTSCKSINDNLIIQRFYAPRQPLSLLKASNPQDWHAIFTALHNGKIAVQEASKDKNVIHILALWVLPSGYWAQKASHRNAVPYSTWALGSDIWSLGKLPVVKNILQRVLKTSSFNFADGLQLKRDVETLSGQQCIFLPSTRKLNVPKKKILAEKPPYKLLFLGRWHKNKGVDLLLESLAFLQDSDWQNIKEIQICGGGSLVDQVKSAVSVLQKQGRPVTIKGYQNKEEATNLFLWADYLLIPSRIESIPVVFSDALQTMTPAIVMPVGDFPMLYKNCATGEIAKEVTAESFSEAICLAIRSVPTNYKIQLQKSSKDFDINQTVKIFLDRITL